MRCVLVVVATLLVSVLSVTARAGDDEVTVIPSVSLNKKALKFTPRKNPAGISEVDESFTTLDIGVTGSFRKFFISYNHDGSFEDDSGIGKNGRLVTRTRKDVAWTLGYTVWKGVSIFGGYKTGELNQSFLGAQVTNQGPPPQIEFSERYQNLEDKGGFLGLSYGHTFGSLGVFSFSAAYASLDSVFSGQGLTGAVAVPFEVDGTTTGYSYGLKWTGFLGKDTGYSLGVKTNKYEFEGEESGVAGNKNTMKQDYTILHIGMSRYF